MAPYVIIGNGAAANSAAESIRKTDTNGKILMFTRESYPFYYIPALPEFLSGEKDIKGLTIHDRTWYERNGIDLHLNTEIISIDPQLKTLTAKDGQSFSYEKLLLAAGGYSFVPPIQGAETEGVFTLRTLDDARRIKAKAESARELVLIGGGLLGLEAGNGLRKAGLNVTVVEFFPRLLPRQMDVAGAALLRRQMEQLGFSFRLDAKTKSITGDQDKLFVNLEDGESLPADMVLVSAGVRPELTLAKALGLEIDKGVKVDDKMKTGVEDIYAAGDLIEHRGRFYGIWPASMQQGRTAGAGMAGEEDTYGGTLPANTLKVVGVDLTAAGDIDAEGRLESVVSTDRAGKTYRKIVIDGSRITGVILFGDIRGSAEIISAMNSGKDISAFKQGFKDKDFDFSQLT